MRSTDSVEASGGSAPTESDLKPEAPKGGVKTALATLAIAAFGGWLASLAGLPLPWLIGAQLALCIVALMRIELFGAPPHWPRASRDIFLPVLGVMIGSAFTMEILAQVPEWWLSLLVLSVFLVVAHALVFAMFRRIGGYDLPTAFFASFPGGFVEATLMGAEAGGNRRIILVQHFLRMSLIVLLVPLLFWWASGHAVGSASGTAMGTRGSIAPVELLILIVAGMAGTLIGRRLKFPAPDISGAIAASAIVHLAGWSDGQLPQILIALTQLMVGTSLGVGFVGIGRGEIARAIGLALGAFALVLAMAFAVAVAIHAYVDRDVQTLILAFAPGGLAEMSLVALSLHLSVPFVTLHHIYRIFFAVAVLPRAYRWLSRDGSP